MPWIWKTKTITSPIALSRDGVSGFINDVLVLMNIGAQVSLSAHRELDALSVDANTALLLSAAFGDLPVASPSAVARILSLGWPLLISHHHKPTNQQKSRTGEAHHSAAWCLNISYGFVLQDSPTIPTKSEHSGLRLAP